MDKIVWFFEKLYMIVMLPTIAVLVFGYSVGKHGQKATLSYKVFFPISFANAVFVWYLIYRVWGQ